jgi:hypothetical protein
LLLFIPKSRGKKKKEERNIKKNKKPNLFFLSFFPAILGERKKKTPIPDWGMKSFFFFFLFCSCSPAASRGRLPAFQEPLFLISIGVGAK